MLNSIEIGIRIKERQKVLQLKQKDIIEKTGLSKAAMSNYVNGIRVPETEALYKISKALETSMEWILVGKSTSENFTLEEQELIRIFRDSDTRGQRTIMQAARNEAAQSQLLESRME